MSYASTHSRSAGRPRGPSLLSTAVSLGLATLKRLFVLWVNRRSVYRLATLDDHYLRDIGLSRGDVDWALSQPWRTDPSLALAERVERRKNARRWAQNH